MKRLLVGLGIILATGSITAAQAQDARWVETHLFRGQGSVCTEPFWVNGGECRIRYIPKGPGPFALELLDSKSGKNVQLLTSQTTHSALRGSKKGDHRGHFVLKVTGMETRWEIRVEQYLSIIEEWHLVQLMKQPTAPWVKLGTWTGGGGEHVYEITVPSKPWKAICTTGEKSSTEVGLTDADGNVWLSSRLKENDELTGLVPVDGTFNLGVNAEGESWQVDVLVQNQ